MCVFFVFVLLFLMHSLAFAQPIGFTDLLGSVQFSDRVSDIFVGLVPSPLASSEIPSPT